MSMDSYRCQSNYADYVSTWIYIDSQIGRIKFKK